MSSLLGWIPELALAQAGDPVAQDYLQEARQMQALSLGVHIPLVCFGISFPAMVLFVEWLHNRTGDPNYKALAKRWSKVALILFAVSLVTYLVSYILMMMISRYREYAADRGAALITGAPENLMSALQKIASRITQIPLAAGLEQERRLYELAMATEDRVEGMNAFFIVPTNWKKSVGQLFMTHPPLEKRLARLAGIAREMGRPVQG